MIVNIFVVGCAENVQKVLLHALKLQFYIKNGKSDLHIYIIIILTQSMFCVAFEYMHWSHGQFI